MSLEDFPGTMTKTFKSLSFVVLPDTFLGKNVNEEWKKKIDLLMYALQAMECRSVSNKMHLLFKYKDKFEGYLAGVRSRFKNFRLRLRLRLRTF